MLAEMRFEALPFRLIYFGFLSCLRACLRACLRVRARRCRGFASERLLRTVAPRRLSLGEDVDAVRPWCAYRPLPAVCALVVSLLVVAQG